MAATTTTTTTPAVAPLPTKHEEITAEWLSSVLGHKVASITVTSTRLDDTTAKLFITLNWADEQAAAAGCLPTHIMVKGGFNQARMNAIPGGFMLKMYTCEAMWYKEVAPTMKPPVEVAKCWWSGADANNAIVILDDVAAKGCTFGDAVNDYGVDWMRQALEQLAGMHASTWGTKVEDITWFDMNNYTDAMLGMLSMWDALVLDPSRPPLPPHFKDQAWVTRVLQKHWRNVDPKTRALLHNDPHASNTFMTPAPACAPRFLDFQNIAVGSALGDVAYCMGSAMSIASRRENEMALLDHYLECLAAQGGPKLSREDVMDEYRKGYLMGWGWILTPYAWHSVERVTAMSSRYVAALLDHKSMELVDEMEEMKDTKE